MEGPDERLCNGTVRFSMTICRSASLCRLTETVEAKWRRSCTAGVQCRTKKGFNGDGAVVSYLGTICTKGADDMSDHDEWISYSHWGMFTLEPKFPGQIGLI